MGITLGIKRMTAVLLVFMVLLPLYACDTSQQGQSASQPDTSSSETATSSSGPETSSSGPETSSSQPEISSEPESSSFQPETSSQGESVSQSAMGNLPETGAGQAESPAAEPAPLKDAVSYVLYPYAAGNTVYGNSYAEIDASNASEGYCLIRYLGGDSSRIKVLMTKSGGSQYQYNLNTRGNNEVFPFSVGSGTYKIGVYQNVSGTSYAVLLEAEVTVSLRNNLIPFLYPNQQVNFWDGSTTVAAGAELARSAQTDLAIVSNVYNYTLNNISYDYDKANSIKSGAITSYTPAPDSVLASGYGICFDYAAVMATMLRTQKIPTKLVVGYAGDIYHAWISVYITDVGWVNGLLYFDGQSWTRMDPTFADNGNQSASIMSFINNSANYRAVYIY